MNIQGILRKLALKNITEGDEQLLKLLKSSEPVWRPDNDPSFLDSDEEYKQRQIDYIESKYIKEFEERKMMESLERVLSRHYDAYFTNLLFNEDVEGLLPTFNKIKEMKKKQEDVDENFKSNYSFITIAPVNTVGWLELYKQCEKFVKLKFVKQYLFVFEQRYGGIPNDKYKIPGDGLHAHLLIDKGDYKPSHLKRDIYRIFDEKKNNIKIEYRRPEHVERTQKYLIGDKQDEEKQQKQIYDRQWRQTHDIKPFYGELYNDI